MRKNLAQLQAAMRERQPRRPQRGKKRKKAPRYFKRQRRIVSRFLVIKGWTDQAIADFFNTLRPEYPVNPLWIREWRRSGMPIDPPRPKPQKPELRPYFEFS